MPWDDNLKRLRKVLAQLYPQEVRSRMVVDDAHLDSANISFDANAQVNWHAILSEANKQGKVINIISRALEDYSTDEDLLDILKSTSVPAKPLVTGDSTQESPEYLGKFENLMGEQSTLLPVSWLEVGAQRARSVAKIIVADGTYGSGFLIRDNFLLTNNHVLPTLEAARTAIALFNFQRHVSGRDYEPVKADLDPDAGFKTSVEHDWTIVRVKGDDANTSWGSLALEPVTFNVKDHANIIQHPGGGSKQVACYHNIITAVDEVHVKYLTDTLDGASGSPVFDDQWRLIALHHWGGDIQMVGPKKVIYPNQGININCIVKDLAHLGF